MTTLRIIHTCLTQNDPIQLLPIEMPPSPPHSPPTKSNNFLLPSNLLSTITPLNPKIWSPAWHAIQDAMATYEQHDHDIVSMQQEDGFIINVLNPWFQGNTLPSSFKVNQEWHEYVSLNEKLADQIIKRYRSHQDIIWIHDYQLILLPSILKRKLPQATIGLSIYAECPNLENLQGHGRALHRSMLAADLIGLQSTTNMPTLSATQTLIPPTVHLKQTSFAAKERSRDIRQLFTNKRIILCQDTEPTGVLKSLSTIEHYLSTLKQQKRDEVTFIHICTHASIPQSLDSIPDLVRQINQLYGTPQSVPIHFYHQDLDVDEYDALLSAADVGIMMGQHPHTVIAAQTFIERRRSNSPLIVSSSSPIVASNVIKADSKSLATTLAYVLSAQCTNQPTTALKQQQPAFLEKLVQQHNLETTLLNPTQLNEAYRNAKRRLFLFDYDGTLTPIVSNPDDARPSRALLKYLQALCHDPHNVVWIVSGRDQQTLESWIGSQVQGIGLSAEHGSFMKLPGESTWVDMLAQADMSWQSTALKTFESFTAQTPGTVVEQKKASITWHYRNAQDLDFALEQEKACFQRLQKISGVDILRGKMNLEVRSLLVNKGNVVKRIQKSVGADFVLCAGDDRTDEDMFHALQNEPAFCVLIGPQNKETKAKYSVPTSEQFVACVGQLAAKSSTL